MTQRGGIVQDVLTQNRGSTELSVENVEKRKSGDDKKFAGAARSIVRG